ncbi:MAG: ketoacyl-ACP synthase III [Limnochordales bacterium]|nr:ketoacyl-ACP synthase III [Limnochordales bacterium]
MDFSVALVGVGACVPGRRLDNHELAQRLGCSEEWIEARTGIRERRIAGPATASSDLAVQAAEAALESARLTPNDLDLIVVATSTPDYRMPSTACLVQGRLGARQAAAFDLSAACAGFPYGVAVAGQFIRTGTYRCVLVVGVDLMSRVVDGQDRSTAILFGDAAGAVVLQQAPNHVPFHWCLGADGTRWQLLFAPASYPSEPLGSHDGQYLRMNGREVYRFGVSILVASLHQALQNAGLTVEDLKLVIPHQANARLIEAAYKQLGLRPEQLMINIDRYGNTSAASIPLALVEAVEQGRVEPGDLLALVGFGAGLAWGVTLVTWLG